MRRAGIGNTDTEEWITWPPNCAIIPLYFYRARLICAGTESDIQKTSDQGLAEMSGLPICWASKSLNRNAGHLCGTLDFWMSFLESAYIYSFRKHGTVYSRVSCFSEKLSKLSENEICQYSIYDNKISWFLEFSYYSFYSHRAHLCLQRNFKNIQTKIGQWSILESPV